MDRLIRICIVLLSLLIVSSYISSITQVSCNISSIEYIVLQDLYTSTNGANWESKCNENWIFSSDNALPCFDWYGIACNNQCNITSFSLESCNLQGFIPSSIGALVSLQYLALYSNQLTGTIPHQ